MRNALIRPKVARGTHPIETTRYLLATPVIEGFYDTVCGWIDSRSPGGMIYGRPRFGKTKAVQYLAQVLPERFGRKMPIFLLPCRDYRLASEKVFFEDLLRAAGHAVTTGRGSAAAKRDRLREFLSEKVQASEQNRLILFVDEAQKLHEYQYKWLIDLHNELDWLGVNFLVLLVGQEDLAHQYTAFSLAGKQQIIGRFMIHRIQFHGLRTVEDIRACLEGYDECSEYPPQSGWSFTKYFFPDMFSSSEWRLANYAAELWEAFLQIRDEQGIPGKAEVPMQYFCRTVEYALRRFGTEGKNLHFLSINVWKEAIKNSGYVDAERYIVTACD